MKSGEIVPLSCQTMFLETFLKEEFGKSFSMWTEPFLAISNNFGLMLNVDWFQPSLHGSESIDVIYMVVMNFQERNASNLKILLLLE